MVFIIADEANKCSCPDGDIELMWRVRLARQTARDFTIAFAVVAAFTLVVVLSSGTIRELAARHMAPVPASSGHTATLDQPSSVTAAATVVPVATSGGEQRTPPGAPRAATEGTDAVELVIGEFVHTSTRAELEQASPGDDRGPALIVIAFLFATMSALTLGFWRHFRRVYDASRPRT
ncbi:MAG: hypothetical protein AB7E70_07120 [Hyphomicrobiaceae bacterium]